MKCMDMKEFEQKLGEIIVEEIIKPIAPKPLTETREERMKREYAPVIGDYGWLTSVQKDATGQLVMKCPAIVELVSGERVCLKSKSGRRIGWTNTKCEKNGDGYSDFFYNMSGYWRCMTLDFATAEDIEKAFPGAEYVEAETDAARSIVPEKTYDRQAEMRARALRLRPEEVFETRYECQAVRIDELKRIGRMLMRETKRENSKRKYEPYIIGCDLAQGADHTGYFDYHSKQGGTK